MYSGSRNEDGVLTKYEGWWERDERSGPSGGNSAVFRDGSLYQGGVKRGGLFEGQGRYEWAVGHVYEGTWKDGMMDGTQGCTFTHANGRVHKGTFKRNLYLNESGKQAVFVNPLEDEAH